MRQDAALTGVALATRLAADNPNQHWPDSSKITKIERGQQLPTVDEIRAWSVACDGSKTVTRALIASRSRAETWRQRMEGGMAAVQASYLELYESATRIASVDITTVPGLVQIDGYARSILWAMMTAHLGHDQDPADIDVAVVARLRRQEHLYDLTKRFDLLITEPVLYWQYAPPEVMAAQMDRLLNVQALANVRFGIIGQGDPMSMVIEHSFATFDDLVIVETAASEYLHEADDEATALLNRLDHYWTAASEGQEARAMILAAADRYRSS